MDSVQPYLFVTSKKTYQFTYSQFWLPSGTSLKMYLTLCKIRTHIQFIQDMSELLILMTQAIFWMIFFQLQAQVFLFLSCYIFSIWHCPSSWRMLLWWFAKHARLVHLLTYGILVYSEFIYIQFTFLKCISTDTDKWLITFDRGKWSILDIKCLYYAVNIFLCSWADNLSIFNLIHLYQMLFFASLHLALILPLLPHYALYCPFWNIHSVTVRI